MSRPSVLATLLAALLALVTVSVVLHNPTLRSAVRRPHRDVRAALTVIPVLGTPVVDPQSSSVLAARTTPLGFGALHDGPFVWRYPTATEHASLLHEAVKSGALGVVWYVDDRAGATFTVVNRLMHQQSGSQAP